MATFEETLVSLIEGNSSLKCYPLQKPQAVTVPVVVYKRLTTTPQRIQNGKSTFNQVRMALTIYGASYAEVRSAGVEVNNLLDLNQVEFNLAYLVDQKDFKDPEAGLYYTYIEYVILAHLD